jgi:predicted flavoprotein YhiN
MESRIVKGLYLTGEVLDYDGPCGGYNLNNAWLTGIKAGRGIAQSR